MGAVQRVAWLQLSAGRRRFVGMVVLVGVAAGLALGAAAGARRTGSAFMRMLERYPGPDVIIPNVPDPSGSTAVFDAATVRSIPGVRIVAASDPVVTVINGEPVVSVAHVDADLGSPTLLPYKLLSGRRPDPARLDEVLANYVAAQRLQLHVGDRVPLVLVPPFDRLLAQPGVELPSAVQIVGVYVGPSEIFSEEQTVPVLHFTAAFARLFPPFVTPGLLVALDGGPSAVPAFLSELESRSGGKRVQVNPSHQTDRDKQHAIHTEAGAVWLLAGLLAVTALLVVAQALIRQAGVDADQDRLLVALGMTRRQLWAKTMLRALLVLVVGAAAAVGVMYLVSPLLPVGVARLAEPHPGFAFDWSVASVGWLGVVVAVLEVIAGPIYLVSGRSVARDDHVVASGRENRQARSLAAEARGRAPLSLRLAAALTFDRRKGPAALPVVTTIGTMAAAVAGLTAALVFASSLTHLLDTPRLYGLTWDAALSSPSVDARSASGALQNDSRVAGLAFGVTAVSYRIAGHSVDAELIDPPVKGQLGAVVLEGRAPVAGDEIALGSRTMRDLGLRVGDVVGGGLSGATPAPTRIVGRVVLQPVNSGPQTNFVTATALRLADGVLAPYSSVAARSNSPVPPAQAFVRFASGANQATALPELLQMIGTDAAPTTFTSPLDIVAFGQVQNLPLICAGLLAVVALLTQTHLLLAGTRRRRRDLAILRVLGLESRDLIAVVIWQAWLLAAIALALGALIGTVVARSVWRTLVNGAGIVAEPTLSLPGLCGAAAVVLVVATLVGFGPGLIAGRVKPATVLRSD